jgi:signal peptidase I
MEETQQPGRPDTERLIDEYMQALSAAQAETVVDDESTPPPRRAQAGLRTLVNEIVETGIFILVVFFIVRGMVQNFKIEGHSMDPTLDHGQYILVNKLVYFHFDLNAPLRLLPGKQELPSKTVYPFHLPRRGDIVVFHAPVEFQRDYIKRVIGLPGEHVEIREGQVFINGEHLDEPYLEVETTCETMLSSCDMVVPHDSIYVMGDNRPYSSDSRAWEALPLDHVIGQAWISYWPRQSWGLLQVPSYGTGD